MLPAPYLYPEKTVLNKACFLLRIKKHDIGVVRRCCAAYIK